MKYLTIKETALSWGVSVRTVNSLCNQGRVEGAIRLGNVWAIPDTAEKPDDPRRVRKKQQELAATQIRSTLESRRVAMPLLNTPFELGCCMKTIEQIEDSDTRSIALAEYYYFSGQSERVSELVEPYLTHGDIALRVSACWLYIFANLVTDKTGRSRRALELINEMTDRLTDDTPERETAYAVCVSTGTSVLLHLTVPKILSPLKSYIHMMPPGLRLFVLYIEAHHSYLNRQYGEVLCLNGTSKAECCSAKGPAEISVNEVNEVCRLRHTSF